VSPDLVALRPHLDDRLATVGLTLSDAQTEGLLLFVASLRHWNQTHNLTAVRELPALIETHLVDPLLAVPRLFAVGNGPEGVLLDVGSGAGVPALPWALALPSLRIELVEKVTKKVAFLRHVVARLGLQERVTIHSMEVQALQGGASYDMIVSRAFASLPRFLALTQHLSRVGTRWVYMAGRLSQVEGLDLNNSMYTHPASSPSIVLERIDTLPDPAQKERHLIWLRRDA
jgi:16S rRNA (guanine527-N7)-methyltransferase